jgi:hypothetical protein
VSQLCVDGRDRLNCANWISIWFSISQVEQLQAQSAGTESGLLFGMGIFFAIHPLLKAAEFPAKFFKSKSKKGERPPG